MHYITNTKSLFYKGICLSAENLGQKALFASTLDCFNPQEMSCQAGNWRRVGNSEIVAIFNQYKDTLKDLIDSSDPESLDQAGLIEARFRNAPISENSSADLSKGNCLDKNLPNKSSWLAPKTWDSEMRQRRVIIHRAKYKKS